LKEEHGHGSHEGLVHQERLQNDPQGALQLMGTGKGPSLPSSHACCISRGPCVPHSRPTPPPPSGPPGPSHSRDQLVVQGPMASHHGPQVTPTATWHAEHPRQ
jgi:hypothetical protein